MVKASFHRKNRAVRGCTKVQAHPSFCAAEITGNQRITVICIKKRNKCELKCTKRAKNEQAQKLLATFDLNSSQKCNKIKTEAEEKEGHKSRSCAFALFLSVTKKTYITK